MPYYECVFIARQDIPANQVETLANTFADIIRKDGGQVTKTEQWGLRNLAYRINKNKKGHYVLFNLDAPPAAIAEMERNMRIHEDILRYMTVKVDELEAGPSAILRRDERAEREEGGRGDFGDRGRDRGDRGDRPHRAPRREAAPSEDVAVTVE
ncbi:MAG: 30S ribosomal protein S6 [Alphaproteobacteria bacterium]|nr:30S ribosomal protein S6 [Alphaproteobacteria bacterium]